jgi:hypothetical protein
LDTLRPKMQRLSDLVVEELVIAFRDIVAEALFPTGKPAPVRAKTERPKARRPRRQRERAAAPNHPVEAEITDPAALLAAAFETKPVVAVEPRAAARSAAVVHLEPRVEVPRRLRANEALVRSSAAGVVIRRTKG